jgi:hypothetical protein
VADHHSLKCRCPRYDTNRLTGAASSNRIPQTSANGSRAWSPVEVTYPTSNLITTSGPLLAVELNTATRRFCLPAPPPAVQRLAT